MNAGEWAAIAGVIVALTALIFSAVGWLFKAIQGLWLALGELPKQYVGLATLDAMERRLTAEIRTLEMNLQAHVKDSVQRLYVDALEARRAAWERGRDPEARRASDPPPTYTMRIEPNEPEERS
jgi:hypothetical protein